MTPAAASMDGRATRPEVGNSRTARCPGSRSTQCLPEPGSVRRETTSVHHAGKVIRDVEWRPGRSRQFPPARHLGVALLLILLGTAGALALFAHWRSAPRRRAAPGTGHPYGTTYATDPAAGSPDEIARHAARGLETWNAGAAPAGSEPASSRSAAWARSFSMGDFEANDGYPWN